MSDLLSKPNTQPENPSLSVCMIVRDEEKNLTRCLRSVQSVADELVIVDTGSKDNTISISKNFGAKVFHFKWCNDFAAARNEALKHATGEWILQLDADEELVSTSLPHLTDCMLKPMVLCYNVRCDNGPTCAGPRFHWFCRLFRNHYGLQYQRPYHEGVDRSVQDLMTNNPQWEMQDESKIIIRHYGYEKSVMVSKCQRGLAIMESYLKETPNDSYILTLAGNACAELGLYDEAQAYLRRALEINPDGPDTYYGLGLTLQKQNRLDPAISYYKKSIANDPQRSEAYTNLGLIYVSKGMCDEGIVELKKAISIVPDFARAHLNLGIAYAKKGLLGEAIRECQKALEIDPDYAKAHYNSAIIFHKMGKHEEAIKHCDKAVQLGTEVHSQLLEELKPYR